VWAPLSV
jgi:hypothetical protein